MMKKDELVEELARFKRHRDNMIQGDTDDLEHHLVDFVRELKRNPLVVPIRDALPEFDVDGWWAEQTGGARGRQRESIDFPEDEGHRLVALLELAESMASGELPVYSLGQHMGRYKMDKAKATVVNRVLRPLADLLTDRMRHQADIANPAIRELAGVPLDRIPGDDEDTIFLSHRSTDKELVRPYYKLLQELGFKPWLDEADMKAGDTLHREIAYGFDRSCAVVFFVTENFEDEKWLAREVDHAVHREVQRGKKFVIITLVFGDAEVPRGLREKLWKHVDNEVDGVREIIRALPVVAGPTRWRS